MNTQTPITTHFRRSIATGAAAAALFGFASLSLARSDDLLKETVNYADLDDPAGRRSCALPPHPRRGQTSMFASRIARDRGSNTAECMDRRGRFGCRTR